MMISPIEKLDFIFGKARDEFEMKILISSPIVNTTLFSLLLTRNINWKLISPKGGWVLGQEQGKEKNLTFDMSLLTIDISGALNCSRTCCFSPVCPPEAELAGPPAPETGLAAWPWSAPRLTPRTLMFNLTLCLVILVMVFLSKPKKKGTL